jgi:hypothetical protein
MAEPTGESPSTPLTDIFGSVPQHGVENEPSAVENKPKEEVKDEGDQKFPVSESSPTDDESADEADESEEDDEQETDDDEPASDDKPDEKKAESKEKEEKPADDKAKDKWETDENPFVKRFRDTAANWNREHQQNLALVQQMQQMQRDMVVLRKMADGTYDPETDDPSRQITPEVVAKHALVKGSAAASRAAVVREIGEEAFNSKYTEFNTLFNDNPLVQQVVLESESPVHTAFEFVDRFHFERKYGNNPKKIYEAIKAEITKELESSLRKTLTEEIMGKVDKKKNTPRGLSSSRGSNGMESRSNSNKGKGPTPLKEIFS